MTHGDIDLSVLFDIEGFTLNDKLNLTPPAPLFRRIPQPQSDIRSIVVTLERPLPLMQISDVMEGLLLEYADNLLRYKGILSIEDEPRRLLFRGVQRLYNTRLGSGMAAGGRAQEYAGVYRRGSARGGDSGKDWGLG